MSKSPDFDLTTALRSMEEEKFLRANLAGYTAYRPEVHHHLVLHI